VWRSIDLPEELPDFDAREHGGAMRVGLSSVYGTVVAADFDTDNLPKQVCNGRSGLVSRLCRKPTFVGQVAQILIHVRSPQFLWGAIAVEFQKSAHPR
jgi:hypothetical protein